MTPSIWSGVISCVGHRLLAGEDGVGAERLVHGDAIPTTVDRRVANAGYRDLAPVLPRPEPVLVSPPTILAW
jgi:hypothetical protein